MNVYYQIGDGPWIKGEIQSMGGNRQVNFHSRAADGRVENQITLNISETSIHFHGGGFHVCGYVDSGEKDKNNSARTLYKLESVDVRFTKPKEKKD